LSSPLSSLAFWWSGFKQTESVRDNIVKAEWNGATVAESDETIVLEGNHNFPADAVNESYLKPSVTTTMCPWTGGIAHYHTDSVDGKDNSDATWYYPDPKSAAARIKNRIAFWNGVKVS
jgi:uncharacterized protein (DUF427 family)